MKTLAKVTTAIIFMYFMTVVSSCDYSEVKDDYDSTVSIHNANIEEGIYEGRLIEESFETACDTVEYYLTILDKFSDTTDSKKLTRESNNLYHDIKDKSLIENMKRLDEIHNKVIDLLNK